MHTLHKSRRISIIALVCFIIIVLTRVGIARITCWTSSCAYHVLQVVEQVNKPIQAWHQRKQTIIELEQKVTEKEQHIAELTAELIMLKSTQHETEQTHELRDFCARYDVDNYITGRIIKSVTTTDEQSMIVDVGAYHGVKNNMIAITHNCLLGYVETVFPYHAKIITIADRHSKIPIRCSSSGSTGIYTGINNSRSGELLFMSHLQSLVVDDIIITSGDGYTYPAGFAVGKIKGFSLDERALHYKVGVELLTDVTKLTHVALLKSSYAID